MPKLFVFAGPNGSGKSTIVNVISNYTQDGKRLNIGIYINADEIAAHLKNDIFSFKPYDLVFNEAAFFVFAEQSGLLNKDFTVQSLWNKCRFTGQHLFITDKTFCEKIAQLVARYMRERCLQIKRTFSFETVFSHVSNTDFIRKAVIAGYEVHLYFVSTESPLINLYRVQVRVKQQGHDVPEDRITEKYYRSLELMYDAAMLCRHSYFFDNSNATTPFKLLAHIELINGERQWHLPDNDMPAFPLWFVKYYIHKMPSG